MPTAGERPRKPTEGNVPPRGPPYTEVMPMAGGRKGAAVRGSSPSAQKPLPVWGSRRAATDSKKPEGPKRTTAAPPKAKTLMRPSSQKKLINKSPAAEAPRNRANSAPVAADAINDCDNSSDASESRFDKADDVLDHFAAMIASKDAGIPPLTNLSEADLQDNDDVVVGKINHLMQLASARLARAQEAQGEALQLRMQLAEKEAECEKLRTDASTACTQLTYTQREWTPRDATKYVEQAHHLQSEVDVLKDQLHKFNSERAKRAALQIEYVCSNCGGTRELSFTQSTEAPRNRSESSVGSTTVSMQMPHASALGSRPMVSPPSWPVYGAQGTSVMSSAASVATSQTATSSPVPGACVAVTCGPNSPAGSMSSPHSQSTRQAWRLAAGPPMAGSSALPLHSFAPPMATLTGLCTPQPSSSPQCSPVGLTRDIRTTSPAPVVRYSSSSAVLQGAARGSAKVITSSVVRQSSPVPVERRILGDRHVTYAEMCSTLHLGDESLTEAQLRARWNDLEKALCWKDLKDGAGAPISGSFQAILESCARRPDGPTTSNENLLLPVTRELSMASQASRARSVSPSREVAARDRSPWRWKLKWTLEREDAASRDDTACPIAMTQPIVMTQPTR